MAVLMVCTDLLMICTRLSNSESFGGKRLSLGDLKMVQLQKAQVRYFFMLLLAAGNQV
jgi:hypothetical protein